MSSDYYLKPFNKTVNARNSRRKKKMKTKKSKILTIVALVLLLTTSTLIATMPLTKAAVTVTVLPYFYSTIGVNSPTLINWRPNPSVLFDQPYANQSKVWPTAVVTFTRPDGTTDTVNGPFDATYQIPGRDVRDIILIYTPNMQGNWKVKFYWPGDGNISAVTDVSTFTVGAHFEKRPSWAMMSLRPYPAIGIGQQMLVNAWVTPPPFTDRDFYKNFDFTITKPDGTKAYEFSLDSEGPGTVWWEFYFDQLGTWTIKFDFPGDYFTLPSSVARTIVVQQEQIPSMVDTPLPTDMWTFPVSVYNREWRNIAGPWYQSNYNASGGSWNPYTQAPLSPHILWQKDPVNSLGGFVGSSDQSTGITIDDAQYSATNVNIRTIMAGRGYYTAAGNIVCVDMRTGKELWSVPGSFNVGANRNGVPTLYQFGSRFVVYNGMNGAVSLNTTGMSMAFFDDPFVYSYTGATQSTTAARNGTGNAIKWTTAGTSTNFTSRIVWNTTIPASWLNQPSASSHSLIQSNLLITRQFQGGEIQVEAFSGINCTTGAIEYYTSVIDKSNTNTWIYRQGPAIGSGYGKVYFGATAYPTQINPPNTAGGYLAFDALTGKFAWAAEPTDYPWSNFFAYMPQACGEGKVIGCTYYGVYAFDINTGKKLWYYNAGNSGMETPYNTWSFGSTGPVIGGGVVFAPNTEHSPTLNYRGERLHAINLTDGKGIWTIMGNYIPTSVAEGVLMAQEQTSGFTYAFAKGEIAMTVSVQNDVYTKGDTMLIKGTILDQSPAQAGTAAVSDASMKGWMEYLHMQQPRPMNTTGVTVKLIAVDTNGATTDLGSVTSDTEGMFVKSWAPAAEGTYTIVATFEGSNSYYSSYAETAVAVTPAPTSAPTPTPVPATPTPAPTAVPNYVTGEELQATTTYIIILAIVVIIIMVVLAVLFLRKMK